MLISWQAFFRVFSVTSIGIIFAFIIIHLISKLFLRPKPMKLSSESVIVITGGCMGIGKHMAIKLAKKYHSTIIIIDRRKDLFQSISNQITKNNGICQCLYCDLSDLNSVAKVVQQLKSSRKKIDFFLYNAGVFIAHKCQETSDEQLKLVMNVNFFTPTKMVKQLFNELEGGHIGVTNSISGIVDGFPQASAYIASKHASLAYFNTFRQQLKMFKKPITISIACPYAINTTLFTGFQTKMSFLLPTLDQKYVANRIIDEFINKKQVCYIQRRHALIQHCLNFLPTFLIDAVIIMTNSSTFPKRQISQISDVKQTKQTKQTKKNKD